MARMGNLGGRAVAVLDPGVVDLERASKGAFGPDPMDVIGRWDAFCGWAEGLGDGDVEAPFDPALLGPPIPRPRKVFGVGLNYRDHAQEAGLDVPKEPLIFTKFPTCLSGPCGDVALTSDRVDWEVELVVVVGRGGRGISAGDAMAHVAGYCVGQDISDRRAQFAGRPPQFSMGKSADGFGPIGPALVSRDAAGDPGNLRLTCDVSGERMQDGTTRDLIFGAAELVSWLSRHLTLEPGDLIFTGTPAGVGSVREPRRYLRGGDVIESAIEGLGRLRNDCTGP
jgi:2,4-diketo-3-deoxy-L-fuconate hydrolase